MLLTCIKRRTNSVLGPQTGCALSPVSWACSDPHSILHEHNLRPFIFTPCSVVPLIFELQSFPVPITGVLITVRMVRISFGTLPCRKRNLVTARVSMLLKLRASHTCFRACFFPGRAKDVSAPRYKYIFAVFADSTDRSVLR